VRCQPGRQTAPPAIQAAVRERWQLRTWTADELCQHFDRWPTANVGIRTGDRLVVLDIDPRHGGADSRAELEGAHGPLPATPAVLTGGNDGGVHIYLRAPRGALASKTIAPGLEHRGGARPADRAHAGDEIARGRGGAHRRSRSRSRSRRDRRRRIRPGAHRSRCRRSRLRLLPVPQGRPRAHAKPVRARAAADGHHLQVNVVLSEQGGRTVTGIITLVRFS
jgi:hypothetical protein